jgi:hypothetical protein
MEWNSVERNVIGLIKCASKRLLWKTKKDNKFIQIHAFFLPSFFLFLIFSFSLLQVRAKATRSEICSVTSPILFLFWFHTKKLLKKEKKRKFLMKIFNKSTFKKAFDHRFFVRKYLLDSSSEQKEKGGAKAEVRQKKEEWGRGVIIRQAIENVIREKVKKERKGKVYKMETKAWFLMRKVDDLWKLSQYANSTPPLHGS